MFWLKHILFKQKLQHIIYTLNIFDSGKKTPLYKSSDSILKMSEKQDCQLKEVHKVRNCGHYSKMCKPVNKMNLWIDSSSIFEHIVL